MKQQLSSVPSHGLVWFAVPKNSGFRTACLEDGTVLVSQFLPAAYENTGTEGFLLVRLPAGTKTVCLTAGEESGVPGEVFVRKNGAYLTVYTGEGSITLEDSLDSRQLCQEGLYRIFGEVISMTGFSGPLFDVTRVCATPQNAAGQTIGGVASYYDFVRMKDIPVLQTFTAFSCENSWPVGTLDIFQMQLKKDAFHKWSAGKPACGGSFEKDPETGLVPILQPTYAINNEVKSYDIMFEHYMSVCGQQGSFALVGGEVHAAYNEPTASWVPTTGRWDSITSPVSLICALSARPNRCCPPLCWAKRHKTPVNGWKSFRRWCRRKKTPPMP